MSDQQWLDGTARPSDPIQPGQPAPEPVMTGYAPSPTGAEPIWPPLVGLVAAGTITAEQARAVKNVLLPEEGPSGRPRKGRLLAEVGMYLGAALVGIGLVVFVGARWSDLGEWLRFGLLFITGAVCAGVGAIIVAASPASWGSLRDPANDPTRRIVSVLLTLAVASTTAGIATLIKPRLPSDCSGLGCALDVRTHVFLPYAGIALLAFLLYAVVRRIAPTPFSDLAWFAAALMLTGLLCAAWAPSGWVVAIVFALVGIVWALIGLTSRFTYSGELTLALGLATAAIALFVLAAGGGIPRWAPLCAFMLACVLAYIWLARWQFLGAAALSTVGGAILYVTKQVSDSVSGFVTVVIVTGLLLVAFGALAFAMSQRRRTASHPTIS